MVSLILWFNVSSLDAELVKEDVRNFFFPTNNPDPVTLGVGDTETLEGKFVIACKGWKKNFYQPWLVDEINILPGRVRDYLSRIEIMTDVKFSKAWIHGNGMRIGGDLDRPALYDQITETGSKVGVYTNRDNLQLAVSDLSIVASVFLKDAAINRFTEQALRLLDTGTPAALAGVRRKLAQIEAVTYMRFGGTKVGSRRHEQELEDSGKE